MSAISQEKIDNSRANYSLLSEEPQEEKKEAQEISENPFEVLQLTIQSYLEEGLPPASCAEMIQTSFPEILLQISSYTKEEFLAKFTDPSLQSTLLILYSTALRNSSYNETVRNLNENIESYLPLSEKSYMQQLIPQAEKAEADLSIISKIEEVLNLFTYIDPDTEKRIINIYTYAKHLNSPTYPKCKKWFPRLAQNLKTCQSERGTLKALRRTLAQKTLQRPDIKESSDRDAFFFNYDRALYDAGVKFLTGCLKQLYKKKRKYVFFPKELREKIGDPSFQYLLKQKDPEPQLVWEISCAYLEKDINEFMQHFIRSLDDTRFTQLLENIKKAQDPTQFLINTLTQEFPEATLVTLKQWMS